MSWLLQLENLNSLGEEYLIGAKVAECRDCFLKNKMKKALRLINPAI